MRTYQVRLEFDSREEALAARGYVREQISRSVEMANLEPVWEEALRLVSLGGRCRPSQLRKALRAKKIRHYGANVHESTYLYVLNAARGFLTRRRMLEWVLEEMGEKERLEFAIFGRSPWMEWRASRYFGVSREYMRGLLLGASSELTVPPLPEVDLGELLTRFSSSLFEARTDGQRRYHQRVQRLLEEPDKVSAVFSMFRALSGRGVREGRSWDLVRELSQLFFGSRSFFSVLRHLLVFAHLGRYHPELEVTKLQRRPHFSWLPLSLVMKSSYVVKRPGPAAVLTDLVRRGEEFPLIFSGVKGRVIVHRKVRDYVLSGAVIRMVVVDESRRNHKLVVKLVLDGDDKVFLNTHRVLPAVVTRGCRELGLDLNRLGEHFLSFSQEVDFTVLRAELESYRGALAEKRRLSQLYSVVGRWEILRQLQQVHLKVSRRRRRIHRLAAEVIAATIVQSGADVIVAEDLCLSTRGKRGALARAVTSMPTSTVLERAMALAHHHGSSAELVLLDPLEIDFRKHLKCGGTLQRSLENWDIAPCECGERVNTHRNAAKLLVHNYVLSIARTA